MKTFKDLEFKGWGAKFPNTKQAVLDFENGYGVSVLFGERFRSNGLNTYELMARYNGYPAFIDSAIGDVLMNITQEQVTEIMKKIQAL